MMFGLTDQVIKRIAQVFDDFAEVEEALLYGSRAQGNYRPGSDIDLTLSGESLDLTLLNQITLRLDDLLLPYTFDISIYQHIKDKDLLDHIARVGVCFYKRNKTHGREAIT